MRDKIIPSLMKRTLEKVITLVARYDADTHLAI
jgi:hypothetical protein